MAALESIAFIIPCYNEDHSIKLVVKEIFSRFPEANVFVCDPWAYADEVKAHFGLDLLPISEIDISEYSGIVLAVAHDQFVDLELQLAKDRVLYDIKSHLKISDKAL